MARRRSQIFRRGRRRARPKRRTLAYAVGFVATAFLVTWLVDDVALGRDIGRGVTVGGIDVSRLDREEAETAITSIDERLARTRITLVMTELEVEATAAELGTSVERSASIDAVTDRGSFLLRPIRWLRSLTGTSDTPVVVSVDRDVLAETMAAMGADPDFPSIELIGERFQARDTTALPAPDMERLALLLEDVVPDLIGTEPILDVPMGGLVAIPSEEADRMAAEANALTANDAVVRLEGSSEQFRISRALLRAWVTVAGTSDDPRIELEEDAVSSTLTSLFTGIGVEGEPATISVDDDWNVEIVGGDPGFECCAEDAPGALLAGLRAGDGVIEIPGSEVPHPAGREWAESLGLNEIVGEFTTEFVAGESRVTNIARIAELTRGVLIEPGATFSVNDFIGPRTREDGFVSAGVIYGGVFRSDVGGGISQYATTLFNAAFFAGLDFGEYQSHTIYISRYPYGREATLSYPRPDLEIINNTPHHVMIWGTTTDTSITIRLYSTPWVRGEQTGQTEQREGAACTRVTTERTRTHLDSGRTEVDTVTARYRPEGIACDGSPSVTTTTASTTTTTTTTAPPSSSTTTTTTTTTAPPASSTTTTAPPATTTSTTSTTSTTTTTTVP